MPRNIVPYFEFFTGMIQPETADVASDDDSTSSSSTATAASEPELELVTSPYARLRPLEWHWIALVMSTHHHYCVRHNVTHPLEESLRQWMGWRLFSLDRQFALLHAADFYGCRLLLRLLLRKLASRLRKAPKEELDRALQVIQAPDFPPQNHHERILYDYSQRVWRIRYLALYWLGGNLQLLRLLMNLFPRPEHQQLVGLTETHQMCITRNGLMARGSNRKGELGLGDRMYRAEWTRVPHKGDLIAVCCGKTYMDDMGNETYPDYWHTYSLVLTTRGLYFCGRTEDGPGITRKTQLRLKRVPLKDKRFPLAIMCSESMLTYAVMSKERNDNAAEERCKFFSARVDHWYDDDAEERTPTEWTSLHNGMLGVPLSAKGSRDTVLMQTTRGLWSWHGATDPASGVGGPYDEDNGGSLNLDQVRSYGCEEDGAIVLTTEGRVMVAGGGGVTHDNDTVSGFTDVTTKLGTIMGGALPALLVGATMDRYIIVSRHLVDHYHMANRTLGRIADRAIPSTPPLALYCSHASWALVLEDGLQIDGVRQNLLMGHEASSILGITPPTEPQSDRPEKRLKMGQSVCLLCARPAAYTDRHGRYHWCDSNDQSTCHERFWAFQQRDVRRESISKPETLLHPFNMEQMLLGLQQKRHILITEPAIQLAVQRLLPGEQVPLERHQREQQFLRVEQGTLTVEIFKESGGGGGSALTAVTLRGGGTDTVMIPPNTWHRLVNKGGQEPVLFYTLYAPPAHTRAEQAADDNQAAQNGVSLLSRVAI